MAWGSVSVTVTVLDSASGSVKASATRSEVGLAPAPEWR
jgi:hypothetical protein